MSWCPKYRLLDTVKKTYSIIGRHLKEYRRNALRRGIEWRLTLEEFAAVVALNCHYCGSPPKYRVRRDANRGQKLIVKSKEKINGIDRLDSAGPYALSNCVACCRRCNYGKNDMSVREFKSWLRRVVKWLRI